MFDRTATPPAQSLSLVRKISRWRAAGIHLLMSVLIALAVVGIMLGLWYPAPFFEAMGGQRLLLILVVVDVTIGPLITLIIFNTAKKSLKFDLAVIVIVQLAALAYGVVTVFAARPVFAVFYKDRFDVVSAAEIAPEDMAKVTQKAFSLPLTGPRFVGAIMPSDREEREKILFSSVQGGTDLHHMPQHYTAYDQVAKDAGQAAQSIEVLRKLNVTRSAELDSIFTSKNVDVQQFGFLPLKARAQDMAVVLNKTTGEVLGVYPYTPW